MTMYGTITIEHTVWCGYCAQWQTFQDRNKKLTANSARVEGWKLVRGKWMCPNCVTSQTKEATTPTPPNTKQVTR